jgi:hypothetical protein
MVLKTQTFGMSQMIPISKLKTITTTTTSVMLGARNLTPAIMLMARTVSPTVMLIATVVLIVRKKT